MKGRMAGGRYKVKFGDEALGEGTGCLRQGPGAQVGEGMGKGTAIPSC